MESLSHCKPSIIQRTRGSRKCLRIVISAQGGMEHCQWYCRPKSAPRSLRRGCAVHARSPSVPVTEANPLGGILYVPSPPLPIGGPQSLRPAGSPAAAAASLPRELRQRAPKSLHFPSAALAHSRVTSALADRSFSIALRWLAETPQRIWRVTVVSRKRHDISYSIYLTHGT